MHFQPPTFEPGPVATAIGLALIACLVAQPLLFRPLYAATRRPVPPKGSSPLVRLNHATAWWSLGEVFAGMLFVGTASAVTPADIGLAPPTVYGFGGGLNLPHFMITTWTLLFLVFMIVSSAVQAWILWRRMGGTLPAERLAKVPPRVAALLPRNARERVAAVAGALIGVSGSLASAHLVLIPLLMGGFGVPAPITIVVVAALLGWTSLNTGWRNVLSMFSLWIMAVGCYLFVVAGSLLTPLVVVGVAVVASLVILPYRNPDDGAPAAAEPVMTWRPDDGAGTPEARP